MAQRSVAHNGNKISKTAQFSDRRQLEQIAARNTHVTKITDNNSRNQPTAHQYCARNPQKRKVCRVCGDKAFSFNFNAITCTSCKMFFRRNANKEEVMRCPFNEQCEVNVVSRRFCQKCRLAKCFSVGMKKELVLSEEARSKKDQCVEDNRERRMKDAGWIKQSTI